MINSLKASLERHYWVDIIYCLVMIGQIYVSCLPVAGLLMRTVGETCGVRNNAHLFGLPMRLLPEGKREGRRGSARREGKGWREKAGNHSRVYSVNCQRRLAANNNVLHQGLQFIGDVFWSYSDVVSTSNLQSLTGYKKGFKPMWSIFKCYY